jgi:hypothetical protein
MGKYDDLVFKIPKEYSKWYGVATPRGFFRGTRMMPTAEFTIDFSATTKPQPAEIPHMHPVADEYIVFVNADYRNFFDFDAEIEFWMGDDPDRMEMHTITSSTIIRVPAGVYHAPTFFKRISKPISCSAIFLDGDWAKVFPRRDENGNRTLEYMYEGEGIRPCTKDKSKVCTYCGECFKEHLEAFGKSMDEFLKTGKDGNSPVADTLRPYYEMDRKSHTGNFQKYIYSFKPEYHNDPNFLSPRAGYRGVDEMEGAKYWYLYNIIQRECTIGELHMHHAVEEYLVFTGADINNFFDFDAEIEIRLGKDPDHLETYTVTEPTVIRVPAGMWHGPLTVKRLGAPINFMPCYPSGSYGRVIRERRPDGTVAYIHKGGDLPK